MDFHDGGKHGCLKICNKTENPAGFLSKWASTKYLAKVNTKELNNLPQSACVDVAEYSVGEKKRILGGVISFEKCSSGASGAAASQ